MTATKNYFTVTVKVFPQAFCVFTVIETVLFSSFVLISGSALITSLTLSRVTLITVLLKLWVGSETEMTVSPAAFLLIITEQGVSASTALTFV